MNKYLSEKKNCFIVAELSANHGGKLSTAVETVRAAKRAGADAIKLQTYTADTITLDVKNDYFKISQGTYWDNQYLYDLYKKASLPWKWHQKLFQVAKEEGLLCFSSPFDNSAVDFLEELGNPIYKVASFEVTDIPLIKYIAEKGKPIMISTGVANISDIELAIETCRSVGNNQITILKCTSSYPSLPEECNLITIKDVARRFDVEIGLSDHSLGLEVPVVAVSMGAKVIEKHFILNKNIDGPDSHFSLDENEFSKMVKAVRNAELILGNVDYRMTKSSKKSKEFSRSLFVVKDVRKHDIISKENVRSIRPSFGMHPKYFNEILGKKFIKDICKGEPLSKDDIELY